MVRNYKIIAILLFLFSSVGAFAQTLGFNYQAIIKPQRAQTFEIYGEHVQLNFFPDRAIAMRFSIINVDGDIEYKEEHYTTTSKYGEVNLYIGSGKPSFGTFAQIHWDGNKKEMSVEIDYTATGSEYQYSNTQDLLYLPHPASSLDISLISANTDAIGVNTSSITSHSDVISTIQREQTNQSATIVSNTDLITSNTNAIAAKKGLPEGGTAGQVLKTDGSDNYEWVDRITNTQLTEAEVDAFVANNDYLTKADYDSNGDGKIDASVQTVNGNSPDANGNITLSLGSVSTGTLLDRPLDILPNGAMYVVSGDTDDNNGKTFISDGTQWNEITTVDQSANDSRYLNLAGGTMTGNLNMGEKNIVSPGKVDGRDISADAEDQNDLQVLTGVGEGERDLGEFAGTTISTSSTIKTALQALESSLERVSDTSSDDQNASEVDYDKAGSGLAAMNVQSAIDELKGNIDASVQTVNGVSPTDGNVAVSLAAVNTGTLVNKPSTTTSEEKGDMYVVSGDGDRNGRTFISDGSQWHEITSDMAATDSRYLKRAGDQMSGNLNMGNNNIITVGTVDGRDISEDGVKLDGITSEATKNATDENLRDRTTHTGAQAISTVTDLQTNLDAKAATTEVLTKTNTDSYEPTTEYHPATKKYVDGKVVTYVDATTTTAGLMSATDKSKLEGIAEGATKNATDENLRDRTTHTGEQAISTVTDLQTSLDTKAAAAKVLEKDNTTEYTPNGDYHPATKKYVDDQTAADISVSLSIGDLGILYPGTVQSSLQDLQEGIASKGDMNRSDYDNDNNNWVDNADNAASVTGFTVGVNVPSNAVFTDNQSAAQVNVTTIPNISANTVQDALSELESEKLAITGGTLAGTLNIGENTTNSAALEVNSTSQGFLLPRMTGQQRDAISGAVVGLMIWCLNCGDYGEMQVYNGSTWANISGGDTTPIVPTVDDSGYLVFPEPVVYSTSLYFVQGFQPLKPAFNGSNVVDGYANDLGGFISNNVTDNRIILDMMQNHTVSAFRYINMFDTNFTFKSAIKNVKVYGIEESKMGDINIESPVYGDLPEISADYVTMFDDVFNKPTVSGEGFTEVGLSTPITARYIIIDAADTWGTMPIGIKAFEVKGIASE